MAPGAEHQPGFARLAIAMNLSNPDSVKPNWKRYASAAYASGLLRGLSLHFKYRRRTMIASRPYAENLALLSVVLRNPALGDGAIIECGTWRGGMAAGMIEIGGPDRNYYFFDSFAGLPPAGPHDEARSHSAQPHDNCCASLDEFRQTLTKTGVVAERIHIQQGFFEQTLPSFACPQIAVLRLDVDWYESTMICLETFWDFVLPGGLILIDDYNAWQGCSKAVHAFLAKRDAKERLRHGPLARVTYILKQA